MPEVPQPAPNTHPGEQDRMPNHDETEFNALLNQGMGKHVAPKYTDHLAELESGEQQRSREFGHTVLADGYAVQGLMVPGRNEVVTAQGVLRTRQAPRSSNY